MCEVFSRCLNVFQTLEIPDSYMNYPECFCACKSCQAKVKRNAPVGCCYFMLRGDERKDIKYIVSNWIQCFHGTSYKFVKSIVLNGLLIPGDVVSGMEEVKIKNGNRPKPSIFASPNIAYSMSPCYAEQYKIEGGIYQFVFELRFKPKMYTVESPDIWRTYFRDSWVEIALMIFEIAPGQFKNVVKFPKTLSFLLPNCSICSDKTDKNLIHLECNHYYHIHCLKIIVDDTTQGKVFLTINEQLGSRVECVVCRAPISESTLSSLYEEDKAKLIENRNKRAEIERELEMVLLAPPESKIKDQFWLSCCKKCVSKEEYTQAIQRQAILPIFYNPIKHIFQCCPCPECKSEMVEKDVASLFNVEEILRDKCGSCTGSKPTLEGIMGCPHLLCTSCLESGQVTCRVCDLLARLFS